MKMFNPQSATGYRFMVYTFRIMDLFGNPGRQLADFGLQKGSVVVDYGCGPGRYIQTLADRPGTQTVG